MMISPEAYYEVELKGKSKEEILKCIKALKREIKRLKENLEVHGLEQERCYPSSFTKLSCKRDYLKRAIDRNWEPHMKVMFQF